MQKIGLELSLRAQLAPAGHCAIARQGLLYGASADLRMGMLGLANLVPSFHIEHPLEVRSAALISDRG